MNVLLIILLALKGGDPSLPPATVDAGITVSAAQGIPEPRFRILKPMMPLRGQTKSLVDINSHLAPNPEGVNYESDDDLGHERTHGINSSIRRQFVSRDPYYTDYDAYYVLEDRYLVLRGGRFRKSWLIQYIPKHLRQGTNYSIYVGSLDSNESRPTQIIDEFVAYTNGSQVHLEYAQGGVNLNRSGSFKGMMEFCIYSTAFIQAMDRYDPNNPSKDDYYVFVYWNIKRAIDIYHQSLSYPQLRDREADAYYTEFIRRYVNENKPHGKVL